MINVLKKPLNSKGLFQAIVFIIIVVMFLFNVNYVLAGATADVLAGATSWASGGIGYAVSLVLSIIAIVITSVVGVLITVVISILAQVAQYGDIINVPTVINGWVIVRDLCNMSFILILLIIAFATILRQENFSAKKMLPKLLLMAILINFSRTIFGLLIDFSQVIMLTFVNGFSQYGAANFISMFNTNMLLSINTGGKGFTLAGAGDFSVTAWSTTMAIIAGVLAAIITLIIVSVMLAVLVARIVMLWIYTIFSPLIFLGFAFPPLQKYTGKLWEDFTKQLVVGPVLAFFIWLAMTTANNSSNILSGQLTSGNSVCVGAGAFFCTDNFQNFIIVIGLLMGGLMVAQEMGGAAGSIAGKGLDWAKKSLAAPAKALGKGAKNLASFGVDKASGGLGVDLNVFRGYERLKHKMDDNKKIRENRLYGKAVDTAEKGGFIRSKLALASTGDLAWENVTHWNKGRNAKRFLMGGKWAEKLKEKNEPLVDERKNILSKEEHDNFNRDIGIKRHQLGELNKEIVQQRLDVGTAPAADRPAAEIKLRALENKREDLLNDISTTSLSYNAKSVDDKKAKELDKKISENNEKARNYSLFGKTQEVAANKAEEEGLQRKKISEIDNAEQLGEILREAVSSGNEGLIRAVSKKITKNYDYNEMCKAMGVGTGHEGLLKLADKFQNEAGMTKDASLSLLGEIGVIGKNIGHYAAFGAVKMENGSWQKASEDEYNQSQLAEMLKQGTQEFARSTNRLGLGYYESPKSGEEAKQTVDNWHMNKSAIAAIKLMGGPGLEKHYKDRALQNSMEHLFGVGGKNLKILELNNVDAGVISAINARASSGQGRGADVAQQISQVKT